MNKHKFTITSEIEFNSNIIDDIMVTALEGGINYWCSKVSIKQAPDEKWEYVSDIIGLTNGILELYDIDDDYISWELTQEKFLKGLKMLMIEDNYISIEALMDNSDAEVADRIIQYALFDEIVYG